MAILPHTLGVGLVSIRIVLAAVFLVAGVGKLLDLEGSRRALTEFGVGPGGSRVGAVTLPLAELAVAGGLVLDPTARIAAIAALVLLLLFIAGIARVLLEGRTPDCHCFGQLHSEPAGVPTAVRNILLAALAVVVIVAGAGPRIPGGLEHLSAGHALLGIVVLIAIPLALVLARRSTAWAPLRRTLRTVGGVQYQEVLPTGARAPEFELVAVRGTAATLDEIRGPGRPVLLVFSSPGCGSCLELFPHLGRWQETLSGDVTIAAIVAGQPEEVEEVSGRYGLSLALADPCRATSDSYRLTASPSAIMIDPDGLVASSPIQGPAAIEALVRAALERAHAKEGLIAPA